MHSRPVIDEGIYLWAGRLVAEGRLPYRDFPFGQSPLLPYAFALAPEWQGSAILGGRVLVAAAGTLGMLASLWLALRLAGPFAAVVTLGVVVATLPLIVVGSTVRAQALGNPLLLLGVAALALRGNGVLAWSLAPSLLLWSSGLRLTNLAVFGAVALGVAWALRREPAKLARVIAVVAVQGLVVTLPALLAPADFLFHVFTAQISRAERLLLAPPLPFLHGFGTRLADYRLQLPNASALSALAAALAVYGAWCVARGWRPQRRGLLRDPATAALALAALAVLAFLPHLALSSTFTEYLVPAWALLAPAVGIGVATVLARHGVGRRARWALGLALLGFAAFHVARHAGAWTGRGAESFAAFHRVAQELGRAGGPDCTMLSFETELVVESGCRVVPGLEYSFFAWFPDLPTEQARRRHLVNLETLRARVAASPPALIALAEGHALRLRGPERDRTTGLPLRPAAGSVRPLDFLGPLAALYEPLRRVWLPTSVRSPEGRGTAPILVYRRRPSG